MRATILVDNRPGGEGLPGEWGLSIHIEYEGRRILLDTGASGLFAENAQALGIDLGAVDYGVLSHAHYDHADGMGAFFARNGRACFYLRRGAGENCYDGRFFGKYIGVQKGLLETYKDRIVYVDGNYPLAPGVWLVGHSAPGLAALGKKAHMYVKSGFARRPDDFAHEQSLVFQTDGGLAVFSSCSHGGVENILGEVSAAFPGQPVRALVGGFHLYETPEAEVAALGERLRAAGTETVVTGHCTGPRAYGLLEKALGGRAAQMYTGMEIEL